jgi:uncharacterized protein YigA (DUF484 family)
MSDMKTVPPPRKARVARNNTKSTTTKTIKAAKAAAPEINAAQVAHYLQTHPDFFHEHELLLEQLSIPHHTGGTVSLISKQLELFRIRYQEMENQLTALIDIARENDTAANRMHKLNLALLDAMSIDEVLTNLTIVLSEYFLTDFVAIRLITKDIQQEWGNVFIPADSNDLKPFSNELTKGLPTCGKPTLTQARILFGFQANEVKSCAIVPMLFTELEGLLAIGSVDEHRFHASMGHLFLTQMSEVIATRLIALLKTTPPFDHQT